MQQRSAATLRSDNLRSRLRRHAGDAAGGSIHFSWFFVFLLFFSHSDFFFAFSFLSLARRWPAGRALLLVAELASTPAVQLASQRAARLCNGAQRPPSLSAITFSDVRCLLFCASSGPARTTQLGWSCFTRIELLQFPQRSIYTPPFLPSTSKKQRMNPATRHSKDYSFASWHDSGDESV